MFPPISMFSQRAWQSNCPRTQWLESRTMKLSLIRTACCGRGRWGWWWWWWKDQKWLSQKIVRKSAKARKFFDLIRPNLWNLYKGQRLHLASMLAHFSIASSQPLCSHNKSYSLSNKLRPSSERLQVEQAYKLSKYPLSQNALESSC